MLTPWGHLYLIDFGIARRYRPGQIHDTGSLGSPGYAAPEQYGRARTTPQTDIYGLGATLQTLLTGKEPLEIRQQGLPQDVRMPWKLQAVFIQMMDPDPVRRPRNMAEVKNLLIGLNTTMRAAWYLPFPIVYFGMMTLNLSGFLGSAFVELYFLLIPLLFVGCCIFAFVRSRHATPAGLSAKAMLLIAVKQFVPFLLVLVLFTNCLSLLYAALVPHPYMTMLHVLYLWANAVLLIILLVLGLIVWQRRKQQKQKSNLNPLPVQMPLQQQKRP
jgi:serine/threonine protein kinase